MKEQNVDLKYHNNVEIGEVNFTVGDYVITKDKYVGGQHQGKISSVFSRNNNNERDYYISLESNPTSLKVKHIIEIEKY